MNIFWLLVFVLIVCAVLGAPGVGPFTHGYGYYPTGGFGLLVVILVVLLLTGRL